MPVIAAVLSPDLSESSTRDIEGDAWMSFKMLNSVCDDFRPGTDCGSELADRYIGIESHNRRKQTKFAQRFAAVFTGSRPRS
jgi:hypothetical protein